MNGNYNNSNQRRDDRSPVNIPRFNPDWIKDGIKKEAVEYANQLGKKLTVEKFTTSQIRNFYGELIRIKMAGIDSPKNKSSFHLLHPKLAYSAKRAEKKGEIGAITFKDEILKAHEAVEIDRSEQLSLRFQNFCDLCEAILAFHKAHGGKD